MSPARGAPAGTKINQGNHVLGNVNIVKEVKYPNITASRIFLSSGFAGGAAGALRPACILPLELVASSGAPYHAAARLPNHGSHRRRLHMFRAVIDDWPDGLLRHAVSTGPVADLATVGRPACAFPFPRKFHRPKPWPNRVLGQPAPALRVAVYDPSAVCPVQDGMSRSRRHSGWRESGSSGRSSYQLPTPLPPYATWLAAGRTSATTTTTSRR